MLRQPEKMAAAKSSRRPSPLVSGSPYHVKVLATLHRVVRYPPAEVGGGGGSSTCENPHSQGPLSHVWVSIVTCFFFPLFSILHIFVVVFVSAPASTSIRALSLCLSLTSTSRCLVYLSSFWVRLSSSISANQAKTCAKLTAP